MAPLIYSLFDLKMRQYGALVVARNDESIVRSLKDSLEKDTQSPVGKHPSDFELHELGEFDEESGRLKPRTSSRFVCNCGDARVAVGGEPEKVESVLKRMEG